MKWYEKATADIFKNKKWKSCCYQNKFTITIILVDFYKWKVVTSNGHGAVCMDRWYLMIIFSCLTRTVSMHFDGVFDCSKGHLWTVTEGSCQVKFYTVFKRKI